MQSDGRHQIICSNNVDHMGEFRSEMPQNCAHLIACFVIVLEWLHMTL